MSEETQKEHALFSPSGASRWMSCPGSLAMERQYPDKSSVYAAEGTAAHTLAEWVFKDEAHSARAYLGRVIKVVESDKTYEFEATEEMCGHVQTFVDDVLDRKESLEAKGCKVSLHCETQVDFSHVVGHPKQFGTVDVMLLIEWPNGECTLTVEDLKYGMGVEVSIKDNKQLKTYAAGALQELVLLYNITEVVTVVHQVRLGKRPEKSYTIAEIVDFEADLYAAADRCREAMDYFDIAKCDGRFQQLYLNPSESACRFCRAKAGCPKLTDFAVNTVIDDFVDLDTPGDVKQGAQKSVEKLDSGLVTTEQLAELMKAADIIEDWLRAVRARVEAELFAGGVVPGFKLIEGRKGARAWGDEPAAEQVMKSMRIKQDEMYKRTLISPTQAEKLFKDNKRRWNRLKELITQSEGKPSVAPESHKSPALVFKPAVEEFEDLTATDDGDELS